ncbi:unnamed protein product, partial [Ectocarpus fasciculatus]
MGVFDLLGMAMGQAFQGESIVAWMSSARIHPVKQRQNGLLVNLPPAQPAQPSLPAEPVRGADF